MITPRRIRNTSPLSLTLLVALGNDRYGHQTGDNCLRQVASVLTSGCRRPADLAARYGGEEFAIILPETPLAGAVAVSDCLRQALAELAVPHSDSDVSAFVTVSQGIVSTTPDHRVGVEHLIEHADLALYEAKAKGRDRHVTYGGSAPAAARH